MWFRPKRAIDRVIAENRHFVVLAMVAVATGSQTVVQLTQLSQLTPRFCNFVGKT